MNAPEALPTAVEKKNYEPQVIDRTVVQAIIEQAYQVKIEQRRIVPSRKQLGYELFAMRFEPGQLVDAFLTVLQQFPAVAAEFPKYDGWRGPKCHHLLFLIAQAFMSMLIPEHVGRKSKEKGKNNNKKDLFPGVRIIITDEQRRKILREVVLLNFDYDSNFWRLADYVLNFNKYPREVVAVVMDAAMKGQASFTALEYCIRSNVLSRFIDDPTILYRAALIGPLRAASIESFAAKRTDEFRKKCREVLLLVEKLSKSSEEWESAIVVYFGLPKQLALNAVLPYNFNKFCESVSALMGNLRGEPPSDDRIDIGYAYHLIKRSAAKYYNDKTWRIENLHEVIWTILAQRPFMRQFVVETLRDDFQDPERAEIWRRWKIPPDARKHVTGTSEEEHLDLRTPNPPFLSLPKSVKAVEFVRHPTHLQRVEYLLQDYANDSLPPVGVDAEWSSYVSYSRATILQLAIPSYVFIIDIDAIQSSVLARFFKKLFVDWKLLKIGYQFGEDLVQLRSAVQNCPALYHPENLICVGRLVETLKKESTKRSDVSLDGVFHPEQIQAEGTENIENKSTPMEMNPIDCVEQTSGGADLEAGVDIYEKEGGEDNYNSARAGETDAKQDQESASASQSEQGLNHQSTENEQNPLLKEIKGLSALCERVLGKPLDKAEQCSVWDRRPLRDLQLRYAALDAYCMLMLYDKCRDWASRLDLNINELCLKQELPMGTLPLFFDSQ